MSFERLLRADWVALGAALALLFVMALDWYSTASGQEARRIEAISEPRGGAGGEVGRRLQEDARLIAEGEERNAWRASGALDGLILIGLLATVALAIAAAFLRAAAKRFDPPLTPSTLVAVAAIATALLLAYRMLERSGGDPGATVEAGAPLALVVLGVAGLAARVAMRAEEDGSAWPTSDAAPGEPTIADR